MKFQSFIDSGKVKIVSKNIGLGKGLMKNAIEDFELILNKKINNKNASFYLKNCYDCIRSALQSFLAVEGYKSYSHKAIIVYCFENNILPKNLANRLNKYRILRNDIEYRAKKATPEEAKDIIKITEKLLFNLQKRLKSELN